MTRGAFIGIDLQRDFGSPEAAVDVHDSAGAIEAARRLVGHAQARGLPLILTLDTHDESEPCFEVLRPHNILGTEGHELLPELEIGSYVEVPDEPLAKLELREGLPVVVHARCHRRGLFGNVNADRLLSSIDAEEYVLFGLPTEIGIRATGLGLLERGRSTILVSNGIAHLDPARAPSHLAALAGAGCRFLTVDKIIERYS